MSRFIRLTYRIINTRYIKQISLDNEMYKIHYSDGIWGFNFFSFGLIDEYHREISICKTKHPLDYSIMEKWMEKLTDKNIN